VCCSLLRYIAACCKGLEVQHSHGRFQGVLHCVAVFCSMMQYVAVCCIVLQRAAKRWNYDTLKMPRCVAVCVAVYCSVLQCIAVCCKELESWHSYWRCHGVLQCVLQYVLQYVLQCVAVCCSVVGHVTHEKWSWHVCRWCVRESRRMLQCVAVCVAVRVAVRGSVLQCGVSCHSCEGVMARMQMVCQGMQTHVAVC